jgi:GMP synthase (glutamine-hydrolysing)
VILSGSPFSVYEDLAPHVDPAVFGLDIPILGICYGLQELAWHHGENVAASEKKEYGHAYLKIQRHQGKQAHIDRLLQGLEQDIEVWMSHGDKLSKLPDGFEVIATTQSAPFAGIAYAKKPYFGLQFHPEVTHTPRGTKVLENFAVAICGARRDWTMDKFVDKELERIRAMVGERGQVIGAVSGGVDSTVAAKLMREAIGDRFHAVLVDNGVMRLNEVETVRETLTEYLGINLTVIDASERFLGRLKGVSDPEKKRKIIGNTFIEVFQETAARVAEASGWSGEGGDKIEWLLQGTLYPDVIESISFRGPSATIKTHHNVGGLLEGMHLKLIEPLRELFKDEVRALGINLGVPEDLIWRHPFPGPGIAIRILGEVTPDQIRIVRQADAIFMEEIKAAGLYREISQAFAALLPVKAVGVMGDKRIHDQVIALRAVETTDFMTADWYPFDGQFLKRVSRRIVNEVSGVCRVLYDVTSKPPGTIEME